MADTRNANGISNDIPASGRDLLADLTFETVWADDELQYYLGDDTTLEFATEFRTEYDADFDPASSPDATFAYETEMVRGFDMIEALMDTNLVRIDDPATAQEQADLVEVTSDHSTSGTLEGFHQLPQSVARGEDDYWSLGVFNSGLSALNAQAEPGGGAYVNWTLIHEVGHGLGLLHPFDDGGNTLPSVGDALDNERYTVMSYDGATPGATTYGHAVTPMALDVAALQQQYGAADYATGDSSYTLMEPEISPLIVDEGAMDIGRAYATIWDSGGTDRIDYAYAGENNPVMINLNAATLNREASGVLDPDAPGLFNAASHELAITALSHSDVYDQLSPDLQTELTDPDYTAGGFFSRVLEDQGGTLEGNDGGYSIANGAMIENAVGGPNDDILIGNGGNNVLRGHDGNDTLIAGPGGDGLLGGSGEDVAVFAGNREQYELCYERDGSVSVRALTGGGETETPYSAWLTDIETAQFADTQVDLTTPPTPDGPSVGAPLIDGLGGDAGFGENVLPANDDGSSSEIDITLIFGDVFEDPQNAGTDVTGLNFFGRVFDSLWVNNNGSVTFSGPRGTFTPDVITENTGNPEISPFFGDVETSQGPPDAPTPGGNSQGTNLVYWDFDEADDRLVVTWDDVGFFSSDNSALNSFQLILDDQGGGDFDIEFRYEDINWTTGDFSGGENGLGGEVARAGYTASSPEEGTEFELPQSGQQAGMLGLDCLPGNTGDVGRWLFNVRSGDVVTSDLPPLPAEAQTSWTAGDPHLQTLDGVGYDFHAAGEFVLLRGTGPVEGFEIQSRMTPVSETATVNQAIAITASSDGPDLMVDAADDSPFSIDGTATEIDNFEFVGVGNDRVYREDDTYTVVFAGEDGTVGAGDSRVSVTVRGERVDFETALAPAVYGGNLEGLLGDGDGNAANDVALADGTVLERPLAFEDLYGQYRDDWRVDSESESLFTYEGDESLDGFYLPDQPNEVASIDSFDQSQVDAARQQATDAGLEPGTVNFDNAVLDLLITDGDESFIDSAQDADTSPDTQPAGALDAGQDRVTLGVSVTGADGEALDGAQLGFAEGSTTAALRFNPDDEPGVYNLQLGAGTEGMLQASRDYDAAGDPDLGVGDALDALRVAVNLSPSFGPADGADLVAADFNGDGSVGVGDALDILRVAVGLDTGNQPRWVFGDPESDFSGGDVNSVPEVDSEIEVAGLNADTQVDIQGILVGNMTDYV